MKHFWTAKTRSLGVIWMLGEAAPEYDFKQIDRFSEVRKTCLANTAD